MEQELPLLVVATRNAHKTGEIRAMLAGKWEVKDLSDYPQAPPVDETGVTFTENATLKALSASRCIPGVLLADDSGLEVDALGGEPGIRSARYAPMPNPTDADRRATLLGRLAGKPAPWTAHFHCTVALALPGGSVQFAGGDCFGEIIPQERGDNGFGYDPIFLLPQPGRTMAELTMAEKNRLSHRARALRAAWWFIRQFASRAASPQQD